MYEEEVRKSRIKVLLVPALILVAFCAIFLHGALTIHAPVATIQEKIEVLNHLEVNYEASTPIIQERVGEPVRLQIPSIAVDAVIEKVALTKAGAMDVPKKPLDTGWFSLGPRPGEMGSATISGHVDWTHGATGVFADLDKVKFGDTIAVEDDKGEVISFVVREIKKYAAAADAIDVFSSNDGKAHLNIITCDGVWDKKAKQYTERLVVFADRVGG